MTDEFERVLSAVWPEWTIVEPISISESTTVYRARRQEMLGNSEAAIKVTVFPPHINDIDDMKLSGLSEDAVRLRVEQMTRACVSRIQLMKSVKGHTNILGIDDYRVFHHTETGRWYVIIRMELLTTLHKRLQLAPFTEQDIVRLGIDLCNALEACSRRHIVHLNINPGSVYISSDGDYKLGSFGSVRSMAEMAQPDGAMATQSFIAPEAYSAMKDRMDYDMYARVDIYALGILMYYLANNKRLPFIPPRKQIVSPADRMEAFSRRVKGDALPGLPEVSPQLEAIILKACAFRSEDRYASAAEMRDALLALNHPETADIPRPSQQTAPQTQEDFSPIPIFMNEIKAKPVRKASRRRLKLAVLCVLLAALLALAGFGLHHHLSGGSASSGSMAAWANRVERLL